MARYSRLGYVGLNVSDVARSVAFYQDMVGLQLVGMGEAGEAYLRCSGDHHNIVLYRGAVGLKRLGWQMESMADVDVMRRRAASAGLAVADVDERECARLHQGKSIRVSEPNSGVTLEFYGPTTAFEHAPYVHTVAKIERLGHVVLCSPEFQRAADVALETFNFRQSDEIDGLARFLRCFPNRFHHSLAFARGERHGLHHVNFMVSEIDDIGKAMTRLRRNDVPIVYGPGRHPPSESIFLYFLDPDGLTLEYSFGMETFDEIGARGPRKLPPVPASFDYWSNIPDPRMGRTGAIERLNATSPELAS
jgi:2,3-dihydroxy-p-cumate/2,3-dihydroxybenzoate 3,4-dioxygenase